MTVRGIVRRCAAIGVFPVARGEDLVVPVPEARLGASLREVLVRNKQELLEVLRPLTNTIFLDITTSSRVALDRGGTQNHLAAPDLRVDHVGAILPNGELVRWRPGDEPPQALLHSVRGGADLVALDAHRHAAHVWTLLGWLHPSRWLDATQLAGAVGLPPKLGIGQWGLPLPSNHGHDPASRVAALRTAYVADLADAARVEHDVREVDRRINDRGFALDADLATGVVYVSHELSTASRREAGVSGTVLNSPDRLRRLLADHGVQVKDVRGATLAALLEEEEELPEVVRRVLLARKDVAGIAPRKLAAALDRCDDDGRVRHALVYCGARTGRWTGRGFQPQNLPRGLSIDEKDFGEVVDATLRRDVAAVSAIAARLGSPPADLLATLVRPCIVAGDGQTLLVVDFKQIEARILLWLAGDEEGLDVFRHSDPYVVEASALFGVAEASISEEQRVLGKTVVLGAGYGAGPGAFGKFSATYGVDWGQLRIAPGDVVQSWRDRNPLVARPDRGLWASLDASVRRVLRTGTPETTARCNWFLHRDGHLVCELPSGRRMMYRHPRLEEHRGREAVTYDHGTRRATTYGGKLTENVCQAVARDVLASALVRLDQLGSNPVLHVHDEVVLETTADRMGEVETVCVTAPTWARGLPLDVKSHTTDRYGRRG